MFFKVDYDKMSETSSFLMNKTDELTNLYLEIVDICKSIDENWQSEDSTVYISQLVSFIKDTLKENEKLYNAGIVLKKVSSRYSDQDNKWASDLVKNDILKGKVE